MRRPDVARTVLQRAFWLWIIRSRSEQALRSEFHSCDKSDKCFRGFLGPLLCNRKVFPEKYVSCGLYELLLRNLSHQMNDALLKKNTASVLAMKTLFKFWLYILSAAQDDF